MKQVDLQKTSEGKSILRDLEILNPKPVEIILGQRDNRSCKQLNHIFVRNRKRRKESCCAVINTKMHRPSISLLSTPVMSPGFRRFGTRLSSATSKTKDTTIKSIRGKRLSTANRTVTSVQDSSDSREDSRP